MRLCILFMARNNTHGSSSPDARWRRGEPVDVFDADARGQTGADGSSAFYRVYVSDWPDNLGVEYAKKRLIGAHRVDDDEDGEILARAKRFIRPADLPAAVRNALQTDRHITVTTAQVKSFINKRRLNSNTEYDADPTGLG